MHNLNLQDNEEILAIITPSPSQHFEAGLASMLRFICFMALMMFLFRAELTDWLLWLVIKYSFFMFLLSTVLNYFIRRRSCLFITNKRIVIRTGALGTHEHSMPYNILSTVDYYQSVTQKLVGLSALIFRGKGVKKYRAFKGLTPDESHRAIEKINGLIAAD